MTTVAEEFRTNLLEAAKAVTTIAKDGKIEPGARLRAVGMILDRVLGPPPQKVEVSQDKPWQIALRAGIIATDEDAHASS